MTVVENSGIYLGKADVPQHLFLKYANRHGLIAGATGTGKTVTLQGLAEGFSQAGVPVFIADVKGDLSGLAAPGQPKDAFIERAQEIAFDLAYAPCPVIFWDVFGKKGHPVRTTISEMGPLMLARLLELNDTQEGVLNIAFMVADAEGMLLLDMDDLRAMLVYLSDHAAEYSTEYGNISRASVAAIQRALLQLESQGGKLLFGEPALSLNDFMRTAPNGHGAVNILAADTLMQTPRLYATLLLWLLSELFEDLPEVGDMDKPKLVFFFDEAHLLFTDAPGALVNKIEQLVKLIRSKGVGVYFVTQSPTDIPDSVLGQLGNRVQHALRAFTPKDQKAVKVAAQTFRPNPAFDTMEAITTLGIGEALVSVLESKGTPTVVARTLIRPPVSLVGPLADAEREKAIAQSPVAGVYDTLANRESAYEILQQRVETKADERQSNVWGTQAQAERTAAAAASGSMPGSRRVVRSEPQPAPKRSAGRRSDTLIEATTKSVLRSIGSSVGRHIARGLLNTMLKK
ncbi:MAG: helicase HerA-like domain-containing protein [Alphaproteobacteria bacterium]